MKKMIMVVMMVTFMVLAGCGEAYVGNVKVGTTETEETELEKSITEEKRNEYDYVSDIAENARVAFNREVGCDYLTEVEYEGYSLYKVETRPEYKGLADVTMYFDSEKCSIFIDGKLNQEMYYSDIIDEMLGQ